MNEREINQIAKQVVDKIFFEPCERQVRGEIIKGEQCESTGSTYYHSTNAKNLSQIKEDGLLKPSPNPSDDGTVNFSFNPHLHRFGSIRFLFDRQKLEASTPLKSMCYATGESIRKEADIIDELQRERMDEGDYSGRWRIEHELGVETPVYRSECKRYTTQNVPLREAKTIEYWLPWKPGPFSSTCGCNVSPLHGVWDTWATGLSDSLKQIQSEIREAKAVAEKLGVPFHVKSCYPYATLDRDRVVILDEDNINRLENQQQPELKSRWGAIFPEEKCLCAPEDIELQEAAR